MLEKSVKLACILTVLTVSCSALFAQPSAPTGLTAVSGNGVITLTWQSVTNAVSYRVKRSVTGPNGTYAVMTNLPVTVFNDAAVTNGMVYWYMVSALNASGQQSANSAKVSATPSAPALSVNLCAGVTPTPGQSLVYSSNNCWTTGSGIGTGVNVMVNGMLVGTAQTIDFNALNTGTGPASGIIWNCNPPDANGLIRCTQNTNTAVVPSIQTIEQGNYIAIRSTNGTTGYTASFATVTGGTQLLAYGPAVYSLTVDVSNTGAASLNIDNLGVKAIKQIDGTTDPAPGQIKSGQPTLIQYDGTVFRILTPSANGTTAANAHTVTLIWTASISPNVATYNIYRGAASTGPFTKIGSVVAGLTKYIDAAVLSGTTYYYAATAVDTSNNESVYSQSAQAVIPFP